MQYAANNAMWGWTGTALVALALMLRMSTHAVVSIAVVAGMTAYFIGMRGNDAMASPAEILVDVKTGAGTPTSLPKPPTRPALKYIKENKELLEVVRRLRFVSMFDPPRFREWIVTLNQLQKVYMYILGRRYDAASYKATFDDLRDAVLETMYGFTLVVPPAFKHIHGVSPDAVCAAAVRDARRIMDTMSHVLANFMTYELGIPTEAPNTPVPYNRLVVAGRENSVP
jgi:hypothetical protein